MPTVTMGDIIGHDLYVKTTGKTESGYASDFKTIAFSFSPGQLIGNVYSWYTDPATGKDYFMFYPSVADFENFTNPYFVINSNNLDCPDMPGILDKINKQAAINAQANLQAAIDAAGGMIPYYFKKYGNIAIILIGASIVLPPILKSISKSKSVGATKKQTGSLLLLLLTAGVVMASTKKKQKLKGSVIVDPLSPGYYMQDNGATYIEPITVAPEAPIVLPGAPQTVPINYTQIIPN